MKIVYHKDKNSNKIFLCVNYSIVKLFCLLIVVI